MMMEDTTATRMVENLGEDEGEGEGDREPA